MTPDASIVIPVYNEADSLPALHAKLLEVRPALGRACEIIYVDDGSRDGSFERLAAIAGADPLTTVIRLRRNFGQTAAIAAGVAEARGSAIVLLDADLQNDPADIPTLLQKINEGYDVVSGWRRKRRDPFISRRLPSVVANWLISRATGVPLHDYGCTLKAYRSEVVKNIPLYGEMHRLIPVYAAWIGARITEVPVNHHPRAYGQSKYGGWSRTFKVILDLITAMFLGGYGTKPIYLFGSVAAISCSLGVVFGAIVLYEKYALGFWAHRNPLLLLAVFVFLLGVQSLMMGLLAELGVRTYHESQQKPVYFVREVLRGGELGIRN
ncbi:MAG: glycosyltransferase family 2 protein [Chloroflexi bacterium]|nr:glycosyltransferase family 2 protein [Chloroflexota bacterium]